MGIGRSSWRQLLISLLLGTLLVLVDALRDRC